MKKSLLVTLLSSVFILSSCIRVNSSSSSDAQTYNSESSSISSSSKDSPYSSKSDITSSSESGSSGQKSSYSSQQSSPEGKTLSLTKNDVIDTDASSFTKEGIEFSLTKADANPNGFISLKKGGYITNVTPFSKNVSSIDVTFSTEITYGSLVTKSSAFAITSPMNGAYEVTSGMTYSYVTTGTYFSLYSPLGTYSIESITLHFDDKTVVKEKSTTIDFYTINDTHGAADEVHDSDAGIYKTGIKKLSAYLMAQERKSPETSIVLSSGDMWQGGIQSNKSHGKSMTDWMNIAGFESMAIGNHEFDWTSGVIEENAEFANFTFLGINIVDPNGNRPSWAKPSKVISRGGVKVGVIGAIGPVESSIAVASLGGYSFSWSETSSMVKTEADRLRAEEGCDIVVLSLHYSASTESSGCITWNGIDAVFEGHTHRSYSFMDSNSVPHVQTYANGSNVRHIKFKYNSSTDKYVFDSYENISNTTMTGSYSDEPMATKVYNYYESLVADLKKEVLYTSSSTISKSELASFAVKSLYEYYKKRYDGERTLVGAIVNGGCARHNLAAGNIIYSTLVEAMPFENENVLVHMTYANFLKMTQDSYYSSYDGSSGISSNTIVEVVMLSYFSDKTATQSQYGFTIDSRDGTIFLYDITAEAFKAGKYGQ